MITADFIWMMIRLDLTYLDFKCLTTMFGIILSIINNITSHLYFQGG